MSTAEQPVTNPHTSARLTSRALTPIPPCTSFVSNRSPGNPAVRRGLASGPLFATRILSTKNGNDHRVSSDVRGFLSYVLWGLASRLKIGDYNIFLRRGSPK